MDASRWGRAKEILDLALQRPISERPRFVTAACAGDDALEAEVNGLLAADQDAGSFLERVAMDSVVRDLEQHLGVILSPGQVIAERFRIVRVLGEGGMGQVYEANDLELSARVALKTIRPEIATNNSALLRFKKEAELTRRITHPNVCRVFDVGRHTPGAEGAASSIPSFAFLTMELLEGQTLAAFLRQKDRFSTEEALPIIEQIAEGLAAAHKLGIVHRDVKPGNVMLVHSDEGTRVVVTDFGLARLVATVETPTPTEIGPSVTMHGQPIGTVAYMAPEQLEGGEVTVATDIYAFGLLIYEMATGKRPFDESLPFGGVGQRLRGRPIPPCKHTPELDLHWEATILRCLEVEPAARFQTARDVIAALKGPSVTVERPTADKQPARRHPAVSGPVRRNGKLRATMLILLVALALGTVVTVNHYQHSLEPITSVAVLPIVNRTGNADFNYLSGGITNALTNDLSQVSGLSVTAESVASRVGARTSDPRSAGHELDVQTIVSGSLTTDGIQLLLQIELVDATSGSLIWGETYDRTRAELAAMQEDIARELAYRLRIRLAGGASERLSRQYRTNAATYDAYLKGRYALRDRSPAGFESALDNFQQAIDHDPQYAPAFSGIGETYCLMAYNRIQPTVTLLEKCKAAADRALHLDSTLAEAYTSLAAAITLLDFNWTAAEDMYRRSIQLDPHYLPGHVWYGLILLNPLGRHSEAVAQIQYALRADPEAPMPHVSLSLVEYSAAQYDAAISELQQVKRHSPTFARADELLVEDYLAKNMPAEVVRIVTQSSPPSQESREVLAIALGIAYARMGHRQLAQKQLTEAEAVLKHGYSLNYQVAALCAALGHRQKAFYYLDRAFSARQTSILFVNVDPLMESLRSEERFRKLLSTLHLS